MRPLLALDPTPTIVPVIGVPGFRVEYPQVTYANNLTLINDLGAHANIRFASASSPFDAYDTLAEIHHDFATRYMYLAPLGTRPHALGAVCYALRHPGFTELMYDNPVPAPGRTIGIGVIHVYTLKPSYVAA